MILTALNTSRSMQTRRLAIVQDDPKITKLVKVAQILREIFSATITTTPKGAKLFKETPSRKRNPDYFDLIEEPMDLNTIEKTINSGLYTNPDQFDRDFLILFQNNYRLVILFNFQNMLLKNDANSKIVSRSKYLIIRALHPNRLRLNFFLVSNLY